MADINQDRVKAMIARLQQGTEAAPAAPAAQPSAPAVNQGNVDVMLRRLRQASTGTSEEEAPPAQQPTQPNELTSQQRTSKLFALQDLIDLHGFEGVTPQELLQKPDLLARYRKVAELEQEALLDPRKTELANRARLDRVAINTGKALDDTAAGFVQLGLMAADAFGSPEASKQLTEFTRQQIQDNSDFVRNANPELLDASSQFLSSAISGYGTGGAAAVAATKLAGKQAAEAVSRTAVRRLAAGTVAGGAGGFTQFAEDGTERAANVFMGAALPLGITGVAEATRLSANSLRAKMRRALREPVARDNLAAAEESFAKYDMDATLGAQVKSKGLRELETLATNSAATADFVAQRTSEITSKAVQALRTQAERFQGQKLNPTELGKRLFSAARRSRKQLTTVRGQAWEKYFTQAEEAGKRTVKDGRGRTRIVDNKVLKGPAVVSAIDDVLNRDILQDRLTGGSKNYLRKLQGRAANGYSVRELQSDLVDLQNFASGKGKISQLMDPDESQSLAKDILKTLRSEIDDAAEDGGPVSLVKKARGIYAMVSQSIDAVDNQPIGALLKQAKVAEGITPVQGQAALGASAVSPEQFSTAVRKMEPSQLRQFIDQTNSADPSLMNTVRASFIEDAIATSRVNARTSEVGGRIDIGELTAKLESPQAKELLGGGAVAKDIAEVVDNMRVISGEGVGVVGMAGGTASELQQQVPLAGDVAATGSASLVFFMKALVSGATPRQIAKMMYTPEGRAIMKDVTGTLRSKDKAISKVSKAEMTQLYSQMVGLFTGTMEEKEQQQ